MAAASQEAMDQLTARVIALEGATELERKNLERLGAKVAPLEEYHKTHMRQVGELENKVAAVVKETTDNHQRWLEMNNQANARKEEIDQLRSQMEAQ